VSLAANVSRAARPYPRVSNREFSIVTSQSSDPLPDKADSTDRVEALSDGLFSVAMTLLVLDIRVPDVVHPGADLAAALQDLLPRIGIYIASFVIVGYAWIWHHLTFAMIERSTRILMWINLILLLAVGFLPFSTALIAKYPEARASTLIYGANILWFSVMLNILLMYAVRERLVSEKFDAATVRASQLRGYLQTALTIVAILAGLVFPWVGIASFVVIPIFYIATGSRNVIVDPRRRT
jgi:uncharacterized membrane protein